MLVSPDAFSTVPTIEAAKEEDTTLRAALAGAAVEFIAKAPDGRSPDAAMSQLPPEATDADKDDKAEHNSEEEAMCGVCLGMLWEEPDEDGHDSGDVEIKGPEGGVETCSPLGARCLRLACNHTYHHRCLDRWLVEWRGGQCPTCRADVM
jgi:hypothetical protein